MSERIGIVGLGRMGRAMAARLSEGGWQVSGWTRSGIADQDAAGLGLTPCATPEELAAGADILILSLLDDAAVAAVLTTLAACDLSGRLLVETSTVSPETLRAHAPALNAAGARALDAPVSGGPDMIAAGRAGLYIGGEAGDVARFRPLAKALADRIHHVGPLGSGAAAKVVNNMMLAGYWQTLREALQTGRRSGLTLDTMLTILKDSPAANPALVHRMPVITGDSDDVGFSVDGVIKDLGVFCAVAEAQGVDIPAMRAARASFTAASTAGLGAADLATMIRAALKD